MTRLEGMTMTTSLRNRAIGSRTTLFPVLFLSACGGTGSDDAPRPHLAVSVVDAPIVALRNGLWYTDGAFVARDFHMVDGLLARPGEAVVDSVIDLGGRYVVPPFGDAHTHNLDGPFDLERVVEAYLREGTFYVSVLTNTASGAETVRAGFDGACTLDVTYANGGLTSTLSHPFLAYEPRAMGLYQDWDPHAARIRASRIREGDAYWFIDDPDALERTWPAILGASPDVIKIFLLDAREDPPPMATAGLPHGHGLLPSLVAPIVRRADDAGLRVAAHVETAADFELAVRSGVQIVAHLPGYSYGTTPGGSLDPDTPTAPFVLADSTAAEAAARRVVVTPTVSWAWAAVGPDSARITSRRLELLRANLAALRERGARVVVGSDWFGATAWHEITAMRALGLWTDAELLRMWAEETPRAIYPDRRLGRLAAGHEASFLALDTDPLEDIDAARTVSLRVKQGCVLPI